MPSGRWHEAHAVNKVGATSRVNVTSDCPAGTPVRPRPNGAQPVRGAPAATTTTTVAAAACLAVICITAFQTTWPIRGPGSTRCQGADRSCSDGLTAIDGNASKTLPGMPPTNASPELTNTMPPTTTGPGPSSDLHSQERP